MGLILLMEIRAGRVGIPICVFFTSFVHINLRAFTSLGKEEEFFFFLKSRAL